MRVFEHDETHDRSACPDQLAPLGIDGRDLARLGRRKPRVLQQGRHLAHGSASHVDHRAGALTVLFPGPVQSHSVLLVGSPLAGQRILIKRFRLVAALRRDDAVAVKRLDPFAGRPGQLQVGLGLDP